MTVGLQMGNQSGAYIISANLTPAAVTNGMLPVQTFTVVGLKVNDLLTIVPPAQTNNAAVISGRVIAQDTLALTFVNPTAGLLTPTAGNYQISIVRPSGGLLPVTISD